MQVPLGVLPKSEISYADMVEILEHYQQYIPHGNVNVNVPGSTETVDKQYITTLIVRDYLSASRARGGQIIRSNSEFQEHGLGGIMPVAEDWHAKVCLMEVRMFFFMSDQFFHVTH